MSGRKAFIDGSSLQHLKEAYLQSNVDLVALRHLIEGVGKLPLTHNPRFVTNSKKDYFKTKQQLQSAGFYPKCPKLYFKIPSPDDDYIIRHIDETNSDLTKEIVLLSADSDFIEVVDRSLAKGIAVYWITSRTCRDPRNHDYMVGNRLVKRLNVGDIHFVNLDTFAPLVFTKTLGRRNTG